VNFLMKQKLISLCLVPILAFGHWAMDFDEDWASAGSLPSGYRACVFIQGTGTQHINSDFVLRSTDSVRVEVEFTSQKTHGVFGGRTTQNTERYVCFLINSVFRYDANGQVLGTNSVSTGTRYIVHVTPTAATVNGILDAEIANTQTVFYPCFFLAVNTAGAATAPADAKLYQAQIYDATDTLVVDLVPCLNDLGVPGMYDRKRKLFFANAGTGAFGYQLK